MIRTALYTLVLICLMSCGTVLSSLYGIKDIKNFNQEEIDQFYSEIDFGNVRKETLVLDSLDYETYRRLGKDDLSISDLSQPIQIHYYKNDSLKSFHANCHAKGSLRNLSWNYENRFEEFIPKSALLSHGKYPLLSEIKHLESFFNDFDQSETVVLVYWSSMMPAIAKDAINEVLTNLSNYDKENEVKLYLINTDKFFITL